MATKIVNSLAGLPAEVTVKKLVHRSNYEELWISFPESERICPHCSSHDCTIKDSGRDSSEIISADAVIISQLFVPIVTNTTNGDQKLHPQLSGRPVASLLNKVLYPLLQSITNAKELETELAAAENSIHEAEESFQILRNDYNDLQEYVSILQDILLKNGISFPELYS